MKRKARKLEFEGSPKQIAAQLSEWVTGEVSGCIYIHRIYHYQREFRMMVYWNFKWE
jgi:hypothetical protein